MTWNEIDQRLAAVGKDRRWLSEQTPYSSDTIRTALAPASTKRSERMLSVLSRAIEDEEARQRPASEPVPGIYQIFLDERELLRADRASRIVGAPSLASYCRDAILSESDRILAEEARDGASADPTPSGGPPDPVESE